MARNKLKFSVDKTTLAGTVAVLSRIPTKLRNQVIRAAFREWGRLTVQDIKKNITWNSRNMKNAVKQIVKSYRRGRIMYSCVGVEVGGSRGDKKKPGWRAHMYDQGWSPYPKGKPTNRKGRGKGWRRGLRNQGGHTIYKTQFITKSARLELALLTILERRVQQMIEGGQF